MERTLATALVMATLLLGGPVWAEEGTACGASGDAKSGTPPTVIFEWGHLHFSAQEPIIDGLIVVDADGNADAAGVARHPSDGIYRAVGGSAQCADLDGDGIGGLITLTADFDQVGGGDREVMAEAEFVPNEEIDEPGLYPVRVFWNDGPSGEAMLRVRFIPAARP